MNEREIAIERISDLHGRAAAWHRASVARRANANDQGFAWRGLPGRSGRALCALLFLPALTVLLLGAMPVRASTAASAGIDPGAYVVVTKPFPYYGRAVAVGGYLSCPTGTRAVSSGALTNDVTGELRSNLTTFDGNGAYVTASGRAGQRMEASVRCLMAARLAGSILVSKRISGRQPGLRMHEARVTCPAGTVAYGGGAFVDRPGSGPEGGLDTHSSLPTADGTGWTYKGFGDLAGSVLTVSTHCLSAGQFGPITAASDEDANSTTRSGHLAVAARCPNGHFAYAGGARLVRTETTETPYSSWLASSAMTADNRGWYASAYAMPGVRLVAYVRCTSRPLP